VKIPLVLELELAELLPDELVLSILLLVAVGNKLLTVPIDEAPIPDSNPIDPSARKL